MKYQFMPLFLGDLLANTMHLSTHEFGAYMRLIVHAWEHQAKVPVRRAQHIAQVSNFHWTKMVFPISQFFNTTVDPNNWIHERVKIELDRAAKISMKRTDAALQKHSKSSANGSANDHHTTTILHKQSYLGEEASPMAQSRACAPDGARAPAPPQPLRQGMSPDMGNHYRSPPRKTDEPPMAADRPDFAALNDKTNWKPAFRR